MKKRYIDAKSRFFFMLYLLGLDSEFALIEVLNFKNKILSKCLLSGSSIAKLIPIDSNIVCFHQISSILDCPHICVWLLPQSQEVWSKLLSLSSSSSWPLPSWWSTTSTLLRRYKSWLVFLLCSSCFLMSLPCVSYSGSIRTQQEQIKASSKSIFVSGAFVFQIMDDYGGGMSVMWIAIFEMFFIMWIYGSQNFARVSTFIWIEH